MNRAALRSKAVVCCCGEEHACSSSWTCIAPFHDSWFLGRALSVRKGYSASPNPTRRISTTPSRCFRRLGQSGTFNSYSLKGSAGSDMQLSGFKTSPSLARLAHQHLVVRLVSVSSQLIPVNAVSLLLSYVRDGAAGGTRSKAKYNSTLRLKTTPKTNRWCKLPVHRHNRQPGRVGGEGCTVPCGGLF